ncbi:MAG: type IV secretory system conjugative DNA transfer family protein [Erysipelotrichaceae bacterium]|nr:type IV secretory system conjugative DNA transfer family protein [Erysipelotrichaceae bacterium]
MCENNELYIDIRNTMNMIYGMTGSGKTRRLLIYYIISCALAHESMIIPDIKGELSSGSLSSKMRGVLEKEGYRCLFLDFRDMMSDGFNVLEIPYRLYQQDLQGEAQQLISDLANNLGEIYNGSKADPFWQETATQAFEGIIGLLMEVCDDIDYMNFQTVQTYLSEQGCDYLDKTVDLFSQNSLILTKLRAVLAEPERTRFSTLATLNTFITPFLSNEKLSQMLSKSTFDIECLYKEKTALFIILPDENETYKRISGIILQQINSALILAAYNHHGKLPRRVNFICDEFCNFHVPNMSANISASRSRNIRWTMVCQSKKQLQNAYDKAADVIEANCENIFLLNTNELTLLQELSEKAGQTQITYNQRIEPLISVQNLMSLKTNHEYTEVLYQSKGINFISKMPDIDQYEPLKKYNKTYTIPKYPIKPVKVYQPEQLYNDVRKALNNNYVDYQTIDDLFFE